MREPRSLPAEKSPVLPSHRVPAHLARRFHQICLGVTAEILLHEDLTPLLWGVMAAVLEQPGSGQRQLANSNWSPKMAGGCKARLCSLLRSFRHDG